MSKKYFGNHATQLLIKSNEKYKILAMIKKIYEFGGNAVQIFTNPPQSLKSFSKITEEECKLIKKFITKNDIKLYSHTGYYTNFAKKPIFTYKRIVDFVSDDICKIEQMGGCAVIIHAGKNIDNISPIKCLEKYIPLGIIASIEKAKKKLNVKKIKTKILIENEAGQGSAIGTKISELKNILQSVLLKKYQKNIGICLDTAHLWSAGYDISTKNKLLDFIQKIEMEITWKKVKLIHLNNTSVKLGSHIDRHANIKKGLIPEIIMRLIIKFCFKNNISIIGEPNDKTAKNIKNNIKFFKNI